MSSTGTAAEEPPKMIIVMGVTGAGKSNFINKLCGQPLTAEGDDLKSCTRSCLLVPVEVGQSKILMIDTPGFDDTSLLDTEVLREIASVLAAQYQLGAQLCGVIYIQRISDIRWGNSASKTLRICREICGNEALQNVMLVTSRWGDVDDDTGSSRERQLRDVFFSSMLRNGSTMSRFHDSRDSAIGLVSQLLMKGPVALAIQKELVDQEKNLLQTGAGAFLNEGLEDMRAQHERELEVLEAEKGDIGQEDRMRHRKWQMSYDKEMEGLERAKGGQEGLNRAVGRDVREGIERRRMRARWAVAGTTVMAWTLEVLGMFVGIPPGTATLLTAWLTDSSGENAEM